MNEKEELIKRKRQSEAIQKNLMGLEGKIGFVLKYLGEPIIDQTGMGWHQVGKALDFWYIPDDEPQGLPTADEDEEPDCIGYYYNALSRGIHMDISYKSYEKKLQLEYKSYPVYCEVDNELEMYVPGEEWENQLDRLYETAKKVAPAKIAKMEEEEKEEEEREIFKFLKDLRRKWGI